MTSYDILGSIAICKFPDGTKKSEKVKLAKGLLKRVNVKTVVEKAAHVKGRLRTIKTRYLGGERTLETVYKENDCLFKLDIEKCYFSPRLSNERLEVAKMIKKGDRVLVMFAGVGPFPVVIGKHSKVREIVSVELGRVCCKYAKVNAKKNGLSKEIEVIQGDVKKKVNAKMGKFDVIVMPRPNLKDSFLEQAFKVSKKGTRIIYHGFGHVDDIGELVDGLKEEAKKLKKKIKVLKVSKAGDIAPYKFRWRIVMRVC